MGKKGLRLVNWTLWRPAANIMRRLRFPGKMALISTAFLLPMVWLLAGFLAGERKDLAFLANERQGVLYAQQVYGLMQASDNWRYAARSQALGDSA